jgi:hypothetical protein
LVNWPLYTARENRRTGLCLPNTLQSDQAISLPLLLDIFFAF